MWLTLAENSQLLNSVIANFTVRGIWLESYMPLIMGRDPVEFARRTKHKSPAMQVRDECYTKNHLSLIM